MTPAELERLPIDTEMCALFIQDDDGVFYDFNGARWTVGWKGGQRVRQPFGWLT